jgi:hypothetical protein
MLNICKARAGDVVSEALQSRNVRLLSSKHVKDVSVYNIDVTYEELDKNRYLCEKVQKQMAEYSSEIELWKDAFQERKYQNSNPKECTSKECYEDKCVNGDHVEKQLFQLKKIYDEISQSFHSLTFALDEIKNIILDLKSLS